MTRNEHLLPGFFLVLGVFWYLCHCVMCSDFSLLQSSSLPKEQDPELTMAGFAKQLDVPTGPELRKLKTVRANAASLLLAAELERILQSGRPNGFLVAISDLERVFRARLDIEEELPKQLDICRLYLQALGRYQAYFDGMVKAGGSQQDWEYQRYQRLDAAAEFVKLDSLVNAGKVSSVPREVEAILGDLKSELENVVDQSRDNAPIFVNLKRLEITAEDSRLPRLLKARANTESAALRLVYAKEWARGGTGRMLDSPIEIAKRVLQSRLALTEGVKEQLDIHRHYVELLREYEANSARRMEVGTVKPEDFEKVRYHRISGEIEVLKLAQSTSKIDMPENSSISPQGKKTDNGNLGPRTDMSKWPEFAKAPVYESGDGETGLVRLTKARANAALNELRIRYANFLKVHDPPAELIEVAQRTLEARLALTTDDAGRLATRREHLVWLREVARIQEALVKSGILDSTHDDVITHRRAVELCRFHCLDAEIELLKRARGIKP